jgi:hypothetical protein
MESEHNNQGRLGMLKDNLAILAADAGDQLAHLAQMDVPVCIDELALDYDAIAAAAGDMLGKGELNSDQCACVTCLNTLLKQMSGKLNAHLWTAEGLYSAPEWTEVRRRARECLILFE